MSPVLMTAYHAGTSGAGRVRVGAIFRQRRRPLRAATLTILTSALLLFVGPDVELAHAGVSSSTVVIDRVPATDDVRFLVDALERRRARKAAAKAAAARAVIAARTPVAVAGTCGGDLPPCWVLDRESGHKDGVVETYDLHAYNENGCGGAGCRGKWQCHPDTCDGTGSEEEQDAEARRVWDGGRGCSHWAACG